MGKGGRIFCIFTPYLLTIASLICLIIVGLGSTNNGTSSLRDLYFFRIDIHNLTSPTIIQASLDDALGGDLSLVVDDGDIRAAIEDVEKYFNIQDFYNIGLWGYCGGNVTAGDNQYRVVSCSSPKSSFWFDPTKVWNLDQLGLDNAIPDDIQSGLNIYKKVSKWMFAAYIVAFSVTGLELLLGITAIFSRWGSCVTTLVSMTAFFFTAAASATSTALSIVLPRILNDKLNDSDISANMGKNIFAATWIATAFSLGACLFWAFSSCCCSGRSPYHHSDSKTVATEKVYEHPYHQRGQA